MKVKQLSLLLLLLVALFSSCDKGVDPVTGKYESGIFVVNEGPFGGTGTITWHDPVTGETVQDIYGKANDGAVLGELVQSLTFSGNKGYICIGNGTSIIVVDAATFKFQDTIGGLSKPRHLLPYGDHFALVTQWGADGNTGTIAKIDLTTNLILETSPVIGAGPDKIFQINSDEVLITNAGGYSEDSTIVRFRLSTFSEESRTTVGGKNPVMCAPLNGINSGIYVLCNGLFPGPSWLGLADGTTNGETVPYSYSDDLCASPDNSALYFIGADAIYTLKNGTVSIWAQQEGYGLACHPVTGEVICTDAGNFDAAGEAVIFRPDGTKTSTFPTGIGPGEIVIEL